MWLNHHTVFNHPSKASTVPSFHLNLFLLMTIVFIPYSTGVLGSALATRREGARTAAVLYSATMAVDGLGVGGAGGSMPPTIGGCAQPAFPEEQRRTTTLLFTAGSVPYTVSVAVAFVSPYVCLAFHAVIAVYYALDPISRRDAVASSVSDHGKSRRRKELS